MRVRPERGGARTAVAWLAGLVSAGAVIWAVRDYRQWRSLGPGGLPATPRGWFTMTRFRLIARDRLDVRPLLADLPAPSGPGFLTSLRARIGDRPTISPYPVPHRQLDQLPETEVRQKLQHLFDRMVEQHINEVHYALSHFEKRHPAITLKLPGGKVAAAAEGEIAHIHPSDSSMHMILSPADAVAAIEMGWGERHGLAGIAVGLPQTYVMIYAPREEEDLANVEELLVAAIRYAEQPDDPL